MLRFLLLAILLLVAVSVSMQYKLDKRGAAWFLRPNWKPPTKRFFINGGGDGGGVSGYIPSEYDQYILY